MVDYDQHTALLIVDLQNDFADPRGSLYVRGGQELVQVANSEAARARAAGASVFYTQDWHPPTTPHFAKDGGIWPVHCVHGSWGAAFLPGLVVDGPVVRKGTGPEDGYSGFSVRDLTSGQVAETELAALLRERDIARVVVAGIATDYCVRETALDARRLGFAVVVLANAVRAVDLHAGDGVRAFAAMHAAGVEFANDPRPAPAFADETLPAVRRA